MVTKINKLIKNPVKFIPVVFRKIKQLATYFFQNKSFFLQGQMDIHPASGWHNVEFINETGGFLLLSDDVKREVVNLEPWDNTRRDMLILLLRTIAEKNILGDIAEVGVYKGNTAKLFHYYMPEKKLHLFDTFQGFTERSVGMEKRKTQFNISKEQFSDTSLDLVKKNIRPQNENISYYVGYFPDTVTKKCEESMFAFVHLDADLYDPIFEGLSFFYPRLNNGGMIVVHDYNAWVGARNAVNDFFMDKDEYVIPMPDKSGSAVIIKQFS
jgi:O-methyltransferase